MSTQQKQQQAQQTPRILFQSDVIRFVELSSSYYHPEWFQSVKNTMAGYHCNGVALYRFQADEAGCKLELSPEDMTVLISSYLKFLVDFNLVQHDERLTQAFTAFMQAPEQVTPNDDFLSDDDLGDLDEAPF